MKEFIHKIRQILMSTRIIENRSKYLFLSWGCFGIHLIFTILMLLCNVYALAGLNILATIFYAILALVLVPNEKYKLLFILASFEVGINASVSSIMLGEGFDFMIYTLSLIPGAFYLADTWPKEKENKHDVSWIPIVETMIICIVYVLVDVLQDIVTPVYMGEKILAIKTIFHYFNIMISLSLLMAFSVLFALEVRYIQKLLNDENSRLGEIASRDPLTKAFNRRSFNETITAELDKDEDIQFGLIILDIDDFKKVNDTYGHIVGDKVLVSVSATLKSIIRENDYFCRWGGEEFLILVHGNNQDCETVAERVRADIAEMVFEEASSSFSVTATLGISEYQKGIKIRTLVDMADQKLYYGKTHGKNQVVK